MREITSSGAPDPRPCAGTEPIRRRGGTEGEEVHPMSDEEKEDLRWVVLMVLVGVAIGALIMLGPWAGSGM